MSKGYILDEWRQIQSLLDKIRGTGKGGISADDPEAVQKLKAKLAGLEQDQERMKAVNFARYTCYVSDKRSLDLRDVVVDHYDLKLRQPRSQQER